MKKNLNTKLSAKERLCYGAGDFSGNLVYSSITAFLLIYYTNVAGVSPALAAAVIAVSKIFDGVSDLVMGVIVDRTHSKYGKARPWLLRLCIPLALSMVLMFSVPAGLKGGYRIIYIFVTYNLVSTVFYTGINVPFAAMNGLLTADQYERGILGNLRMLMGVAATMTVNTVVFRMVRIFGDGGQYDQRGWTLTFMILALAVIVFYAITFFNCRERVVETKKDGETIPLLKSLKGLVTNRYWITIVGVMFLLYTQMACFFGSAAFYAQYNLGDALYYSMISNSVSVAQILTMFLAPLLMKKIRKRNTLMAGMVVAGVGFLGAGLSPSILPLQVGFSIIKGIGSGCGAATMFGLLQDSITFGQWKNGFGSSGLGNAASSFCTKLGSGIGTALLGAVLSAGGFRAESAVQTEGALTSINLLFSYIPALIILIVFVFMCFYDLDKKYDGMLEEMQAPETGGG